MNRLRATMFAFLAGSALANAQDWFDGPRIYPESDLGRIRVVADLDGDSDADLLWLAEDRVQPWFNDGAGEFTKGPLHLAATPLALPDGNLYGLQAYAQAGDVNGDGRADVVVPINVGLSDAAFVALLAQPGGTFAEVLVDVPAAAGAVIPNIQGLALGDVDLDGDLEVATVTDASIGYGAGDYRSEILWWNWNGSGFTPGLAFDTTSNLPTRVTTATALDATGDGRADVVLSGNDDFITGNWVRVLPTVHGHATLGALFPVSHHGELATGDLDGDGDADFVLAGSVSCPDLQVTAFLHTGPATFQPVTSPVQPLQETFCAYWAHPVLGDLDGDGDLDLFQNWTRLHTFVNDGAAVFHVTTAVAADNDSAFTGEAAGTADLDQDGDLDVVCPRTIVFGTGAPPIELQSPHGGTGFVSDFVAHDYDDDGDVDVVREEGRVGVNDGTGAFPLSQPLWPPAPGPPLSFFSSAFAFGDLDGDGRGDYLVARFSNFPPVFTGDFLLADDGVGGFTKLAAESLLSTDPTVSSDSESQPRATVDVDGDGTQDLPIHGGYWPNPGTGKLAAFVPLFSATESVDWADVDGDSDLDALTKLDAGGTSTWQLQRRGAGLAFAAETLRVEPVNTSGLHGRFLDVDGDGDLDVAVPVRLGGSVSVRLFENAGGAFVPPVEIAGGPGLTLFVGVSDVDGDGLVDLVCDRQVSAPANLQVHRRNGAAFAAYDEHRDWMAGNFRAFVDVDEDGDDDVLGQVVVRNRRLSGPGAGIVKQYGAGSAGTGGAVPILGASGPLQPASTTATLRIRRARGGASAVMFIGLAPASIKGTIPGATLLVLPPVTVVTIPLGGAPGVAGAGALTLDLTPFLPLVPGLDVYHQLIVIDPGVPKGVAATNGLELRYGN